MGLVLFFFRELLGPDSISDPLEAALTHEGFLRWRGDFVWSENPSFVVGDVLFMRPWEEMGSEDTVHVGIGLRDGLFHADRQFGQVAILPWRHLHRLPDRIMRHKELALNPPC